jgi:heme oxygenase
MGFKEIEELDEGTSFLKFSDIPEERRLSNRPDLNAFLLLDRLVPGTSNIVSAAKHDEFYLGIDVQELDTATEEQMLDLIRSGVSYASDVDGLYMFT